MGLASSADKHLAKSSLLPMADIPLLTGSVKCVDDMMLMLAAPGQPADSLLLHF
jgi:hypothetical protein